METETAGGPIQRSAVAIRSARARHKAIGMEFIGDRKVDGADADDLIERLRQICSAHALGDPHVYARWAPFTARVEQSEVPEGYEDGWDFLARAMRSRDALGKAFLRTESQAPPKDKARREKSRELAIIRSAYAKQITTLVGVSNPRIESAFATVPREHFLGPGPWQIAWGSYVLTPDADPPADTKHGDWGCISNQAPR